MQSNHLLKAGILTVFIVISFLVGWELYVRYKGFPLGYDDGGPLWSDKRAKVYQASDKATVFIGSSRVKFDIDGETWAKSTGEEAIQLGMVGSSPVPALHDLANDERFKGKLIIDATEILFFSSSPGSADRPNKNIKYYKNRTPAQRASFELNHFLESKFVFLDKDYLTLNAFLDSFRIKDRPGIYGGPDFPWEFDYSTFDRQSKMTDRFVRDTNLQNKVKGVWGSFARMNREKPPTGAKLDSLLQAVKTSVSKIQSRGGQVAFIRPPSTGVFLAGEKMGFPREQYWDRLIAITGCPGIYFEDHPTIAHFACPELSHLSPDDAKVYTQELVGLLQQKGWRFAGGRLAYSSPIQN